MLFILLKHTDLNPTQKRVRYNATEEKFHTRQYALRKHEKPPYRDT